MISSANAYVRRAVRADRKAIYKLICELENMVIDPAAFDQVFFENVENRRIGYFIAEVGGQEVGMISCHVQPLLHHFGMVAEIQEMVVIESFRSQGIGRILMDAALQFAESNSAVQIEVTSRAYRERAHEFYQREGFEKSHVKLVRYFRKEGMG